jgi:hypothetical protein
MLSISKNLGYIICTASPAKAHIIQQHCYALQRTHAACGTARKSALAMQCVLLSASDALSHPQHASQVQLRIAAAGMLLSTWFIVSW